MDPFRTPIRGTSSLTDTYSVLSKTELLAFIQSIDFIDISVPVRFAASQDERDFEPFVTSLCANLAKTIIRKSPPKSSPSKFLSRLSPVELDTRTKAVSHGNPFDISPPRTSQQSADTIEDSIPFAVISSSLKTVDTPASKASDEEDIINRFLSVQPRISRDSIILPEDPTERSKRLILMKQITPHPKASSLILFRPENLLINAGKGKVPRRIIPGKKEIKPLPQEVYDYFDDVQREKTLKSRLPFTLLLDGMMEETKLPFVDINSVIHPFAVSQTLESTSQRASNMFNEKIAVDTMALWDTGSEVTFVCADLVNVQLSAGEREYVVITFEYVPHFLKPF